MDNLDHLLQIIIKNANLKRNEAGFTRSIRGGTFTFQWGWGNFPYWTKEDRYVVNQADLNTSVGGLSEIAIGVLIGLVILLFLFVFVTLYLQDKLKYFFPLSPAW